MTSFGSILTAGYRADGMRAWKQNSSGTTYYFYDGDTLIMETDATGAKTAVNTNGPSGLLARTTATRTLLYAFDALGQLSQQVTAGAGTVAATYLFDAWGTRSFSSADTAATNDPYSGYGSSSGYISDWETGLQLLGHRYYDPTTGRFLNRDPIGMMGGVNVYEYTDNLPILRSDPSGWDWLDCMSACIQKHDPLNNWLKGGLFIVGGPIPKWLAGKLFGIRVIILPGGSTNTTLPSICQLKFGWPIRQVGRFFFYVFVGYGLYLAFWELRCAAECSGNPESY